MPKSLMRRWFFTVSLSAFTLFCSAPAMAEESHTTLGTDKNCTVLTNGTVQCWAASNEFNSEVDYLATSTTFNQNVDKVFMWAESLFPQFTPRGATSQSLLGYRYRGYQNRYYLAVNGGGTPHVYYFDNTSMNTLMDVGLLSDFLKLTGN